ncbi:MAG: hypothetical protein KC503_25515 [Myxococcales bacterium]|nr:hypothetical protein [Myxococcales bacterium]
MRRTFVATAFALAAVALGACPMDDDPTTSPDGHVAADGGGSADSATRGSTLTVEGTSGREPADLTCIGQRTRPSAAGNDVTLQLPVISFGQRDAQGKPVTVTAAEVHVFSDNQIGADTDCSSGSCQKATLDSASGTFRFTVKDKAWFSYRVVAASSAGPPIITTLEHNVAPPQQGDSEWFNVILVPVLDGFVAASKTTRVAGSAVLAGRLVDCQGRAVSGAELRLYDAAGARVDAAGSARVVYFNDAGTAPDAARVDTNADGRYAAANIAIASGRYRVELWGRRDDKTASERVACEEVELFADAMTNLRARPLRKDAPDSCTK